MAINLVNKYIPSPNWEIWADTDVVVLGRLITDPKDPESQVFKAAVFTPAHSYDGGKVGWQTVYEKTIEGKLGLWAKCLQDVTGGLSLSHIRALAAKLEFEFLRTRYFLPDQDYIKRVVQDSGVKAYLEVTHWRKPVYLITGIKIAENPKETLSVKRENEFRGEFKIDGTLFATPIDAGPKGSFTSTTNMTITTKASKDYIFAYSLTRIRVKRHRNEGETVKTNAYIKGAAFGVTDEEQELRYEVTVLDELSLNEDYEEVIIE